MRIASVIVCLVAAVMVLAGCTGGNNVGPGETPFLGGKNALSMSFIPSAPPEEVFDDSQSPFGIVVKVANLGEDDVEATEGYVEIVGINPRDFDKQSQADLKKSFPSKIGAAKKTIDGKRVDGDIVTTEFTDLKYTPDIAGAKDARVRASMCYNYKTRATSQICVKKDLLKNTNTKEICSVSGVKPIANSGGPIQITSMEEAPMGSGKIQLTLDVAQMGETNDMFYKKDTDCVDLPTNADRYKVFMKVTSDIDGRKAECQGLSGGADSSEGYLTLYNKEKRRIVCTYDISSADSIYEDSFDAELEYRYSQFIEKTLLIKDVSGESS